jgi:hypothetical protein
MAGGFAGPVGGDETVANEAIMSAISGRKLLQLASISNFFKSVRTSAPPAWLLLN